MADFQVTAHNVGGTIFASRVRGHLVLCDVPADLGGTDLGPLPPELMLTALANCFGMVAALHCRDRGLPYEGMSVTVTADAATDEQGVEYWTNIKLDVHMPHPLDEDRLKAILRHARLACRVRGTLIRKHAVQTTITASNGVSVTEE